MSGQVLDRWTDAALADMERNPKRWSAWALRAVIREVQALRRENFNLRSTNQTIRGHISMHRWP